jgi:WD40-like Beta Propeller Repeat
MRRARVLLALVALVGCSGCVWMERSSVSSDPTAAQANAASTSPSLSQAGRYVAFHAAATNLVAADTNGVSDVFVRDTVAKTTERVSVASGGTQGNGASTAPAISDDGRFVAFSTDASNLVAGDADDDTDIVLHDRLLGTTTLMSTDVEVPPPLVPGEFDATGAAISGDGGVVAFTISIPFGTFCCAPLGPYVRDAAAQTTTRMPAAGGGLAWGKASLSDDGSRVAYGEFSPPDQLGNATFATFVADTASATLVTTVASGQLSHQGQSYFEVSLSGDGGTASFLYVNFQIGTLYRFELDQPALVPILDGLGGPRGVGVSDDGSVFGLVIGADYVITDAAGSPPRIMSADPAGTPASTPEGVSADLSGDGRFVAFSSSDPDLLSGDTNGVGDVFVRATAHGISPS